MSERRTYESDDCDGVHLHLIAGDDSDYYVSVTQGVRDINAPAVRICTSGGAAAKNPRLVLAIAEVFRALGGE